MPPVPSKIIFIDVLMWEGSERETGIGRWKGRMFEGRPQRERRRERKEEEKGGRMLERERGGLRERRFEARDS